MESPSRWYEVTSTNVNPPFCRMAPSSLWWVICLPLIPAKELAKRLFYHRIIETTGTVVLEKTLESPLDCKEIQSVRPKGDQSWVFIGRTDVEDETPILWPPDVKNWSTGKDPDAGKGWRQEGKQVIEDEMASSTQWTWVWVKLQEIVKDREPWLVAIHGISKCHTW